MEILYYFKPFDTKNCNNQVDHFLFLLAISSKYHFFDLFLIVVVNLTWRQMFLRKLRFAAGYRYILQKKKLSTKKITLPYKIDPVQDFPGNNPPLYFYPLILSFLG